MSDAPDPRTFYAERIPAQFNAMLDAQAKLGADGERVLNDMKAVDATIRVDVRGDAGGTFFLNIAGGVMSPGNDASHAPFLTLVQERTAFDRLASEAGDSALALLGGLSGLAGEMKLTKTRIDNLALVKGAILFEVTGDRGFALVTHFGPDPVPDEPNTKISVDAEAYGALRAGQLDPQSAFLEGKIAIDGDIQMAMQLALAAISPD